ncbi:PIG-L family deacetylase [uncultured Amnibacterium sp.]|uniref:PIG-L family deacetylase n=1 Tax=uncultured Amnibacterium sp. TaxID=1631851 RepID=UPI0035C9B03C
MVTPDAVTPDAVMPDAVTPDAVMPDATTPGATTPGVFDGSEPGTPESAWSEYRGRATPLDIGPLHRLVVLAAHPDDETLMAGGLIATAAARDVPVHVVVATCGEASHPRSPTWTPQALAAEREREVRQAVAVLAPQASVTLLRLPDGRLREHADDLRAGIADLIQPGDTVVSTWRGDRHPDHETVGALAAQVTEAVGATLLEAPIWLFHWGVPADVPSDVTSGTSSGTPSGSPSAAPVAVRFELSAEAGEAKAAAIAVHATQIAPLSPEPGDEVLLLPQMLAHFQAGSELFFVTPAPAAGETDFDAMYAGSDDPWGFAERWYERRKRALTVACLPAERYGRTLEIGCSTGLLAQELALRSDSLLATDVAPRAVRLAGDRLAELPHAAVQLRRLPEQWPEGTFDLIVLSETGFYLTGDRLPALAERIRDSLSPAGTVLLCHWRPLVLGLDRGGDAVHRVIREALDATVIVRHDEDDFVLEVLQAGAARSVAQATGLR